MTDLFMESDSWYNTDRLNERKVLIVSADNFLTKILFFVERGTIRLVENMRPEKLNNEGSFYHDRKNST